MDIAVHITYIGRDHLAVFHERIQNLIEIQQRLAIDVLEHKVLDLEHARELFL